MQGLQNIMAVYAEIPGPAVMSGYEMKTTYWGDFRVCGYDKSAILDTYKRAKRFALDDKIYGTELAMVLNWLCWRYADENREISMLYEKLWREIDGEIMEQWKGEDLDYYLRTTD